LEREAVMKATMRVTVLKDGKKTDVVTTVEVHSFVTDNRGDLKAMVIREGKFLTVDYKDLHVLQDNVLATPESHASIGIRRK
jgi:hypothetical protein